MLRNLGERFNSSTRLEKSIYLVLLLVLAIDIAVIVFARADEDPPPVSEVAATQPETAATDPGTETTPAGGVPACDEAPDPSETGEPVTCRTRSATLTIAPQERPVVLGGTQVRLLRASLSGSTVTVRLRVRNETQAEQSVLAGGQELYMNLSGLRVDPEPVGEVLVPMMNGTTVSLRFELTPARLEVLRRAGGRAELGVTPWTEDGAAGSKGVVRFRVQGATS
ncbi:MAG: hypothetical protein M3320_03735 [Actinomycetota bacterium]|nr:hypothetical protein [Actinomycetota bacterium]MDQ5807766.1 hypothetical protein [Actinomycetota bacterium]